MRTVRGKCSTVGIVSDSLEGEVILRGLDRWRVGGLGKRILALAWSGSGRVVWMIFPVGSTGARSIGFWGMSKCLARKEWSWIRSLARGTFTFFMAGFVPAIQEMPALGAALDHRDEPGDDRVP